MRNQMKPVRSRVRPPATRSRRVRPALRVVAGDFGRADPSPDLSTLILYGQA